jgi:signal transduction histidine kinase
MDSDGRVRLALVTVRDVTAQRAAETEREQYLAALKEADQRKDEFLAMLAHELRNPLAPVRNAVQILNLTCPADPRLAGARSMIERQVTHMARLLDDLLEVSRITRGKIRIQPEQVELGAVIRRAVDAVMPSVESCHHELTVTLPGHPIFLAADPTRLEQIFTNLVANAAKYTPDGGKIRVAVECKGGRAHIAFSDNGVGISRDLLGKVFDLFVQVEQGSDRSQGGLGIGLTLVKLLTEMYGGTVVASSDGVGRGATFTVSLPIAAQGVSTGAPSVASAPRRTGTSRRILIVDDNRDGADSLCTLLRLAGHDVSVAYEGAAALTRAATLCPEVVLLDIGLPGKDGYAVARELRQAPVPEML